MRLRGYLDIVREQMQAFTVSSTPCSDSTNATFAWNLDLMFSKPQGFFWLPKMSAQVVTRSNPRPSFNVILTLCPSSDRVNISSDLA